MSNLDHQELYLIIFIYFVQFAVLYEARANTGIDRMKIINSVAKSVPGPHKVDLSNPDKTIIVEIVRVSKFYLKLKIMCS